MFHIISFLTSLDKLTNTHTDTDIQVVLVRDKKEKSAKRSGERGVDHSRRAAWLHVTSFGKSDFGGICKSYRQQFKLQL